jgi:hypothetical protein
MHRRMFAALFAATFALPGMALAQAPLLPGNEGTSSLRITPYFGYLVAFTRREEWLHDSDAGVAFLQAEARIAKGELGGVTVDVPVGGGFGITAAAGLGSRGDTRVSVMQAEDEFLVDGHDVRFGRVGLSYQLPHQVSDFVQRRLLVTASAAAAAMNERPRSRLGPPDALVEATHYGVSLGLAAELPFAGERLALQIGIEDNILWWDEAALSRLPYVYLYRPGESPDQTRATAGTSHAWLLRAGLTLRLF